MPKSLRDLISPEYQEQIRELHSLRPWGDSGHGYAGSVNVLIHQSGAASVLDYGCGAGTLRENILQCSVSEYDPGIEGKESLPVPADLVVCTDVLEHIEPERLDAVLSHIHDLMRKLCFAVIATRPAHAILPNGNNAHLIIHPAGWWIVKLLAWDWRVKVNSITEDDLVVTLHKRNSQ